MYIEAPPNHRRLNRLVGVPRSYKLVSNGANVPLTPIRPPGPVANTMSVSASVSIRRAALVVGLAILITAPFTGTGPIIVLSTTTMLLLPPVPTTNTVLAAGTASPAMISSISNAGVGVVVKR